MKFLGSLIATVALALSALVAVPSAATAAPYPGTVATRTTTCGAGHGARGSAPSSSAVSVRAAVTHDRRSGRDPRLEDLGDTAVELHPWSFITTRGRLPPRCPSASSRKGNFVRTRAFVRRQRSVYKG